MEDNGEIQQEDVSENSTIWTFSHTGGRVMIYFQQPLELNKRRLLLENPQRNRYESGFCEQQIPELRAIWKGNTVQALITTQKMEAYIEVCRQKSQTQRLLLLEFFLQPSSQLKVVFQQIIIIIIIIII